MLPDLSPDTALSKPAVDAAMGFCRRLVGPAMEEYGLALQDTVRGYRFRRQVKMLVRAQGLLEAAGLEPRSVPLKTFVPLLEGASLEEDPDLAERWAALLANAAATQAPVFPSFPIMLRQLMTTDARVLEYLSRNVGDTYETEFMERTALAAELELAPEAIAITCDNLLGLGLAEREPAARLHPAGNLSLTDSQGVKISQLGQRFVAACTVPRRQAG